MKYRMEFNAEQMHGVRDLDHPIRVKPVSELRKQAGSQ
jgi:hypothetical protein